MKERLQKIIASRGVASRRRAEELISAGRVTCNGQTCRLGDCADPDTDSILLDGKPLPSKSKYVYIMLHKPRGYVTTLSDERGRPDVAQLVRDCGVRVYPVGRLDMDSEGLLLLTNDGAFANRMTHPKHEIPKVYMVTVKGFSDSGLERLRQPITLDGYEIKAPEVVVTSGQNAANEKVRLLITISEGRYRQVRRMCAAAGMEVVRLVRVREGNLELGDLPRGQWRYLTEREICEI